jgi:hypothetical protein
MFILKVENWIGELELVVKCESKENAIKALKVVVNNFMGEFLIDNTMEEFIAGFGEYDSIIKEEKFTIPYEGNILIDNMLPQEIARLENTPNPLGGCMVMTFKKFMEENL